MVQILSARPLVLTSKAGSFELWANRRPINLSRHKVKSLARKLDEDDIVAAFG